jgi:phosphoribulokinase
LWKIKRDTSKRGYAAEEVLAEMERREPDSRDFIRPQREFADIVVRFHPETGVGSDQADGHLNAHLVLRPSIPHPDLTYLVNHNNGQPGAIRLDLGRDYGRPVEFLQIDGNVTPEQTTQLEQAIWKHLPDLRPLRADQFGDYNDGSEVRHSDPLALTQLLITYHLLRAYSKDSPMPFARPIAALSRLSSARDELPREVVAKP